MKFIKYHSEKQDADGEKLFWPGGPDGFPFRGTKAPPVTDAEYQNIPLSTKFRNRLFYLSDNKDAKEYVIIRDKCANGLFIPIDKERVWDEKTNNYRIYLEWVEPAYELSMGVKDAIKELDSSSTTLHRINATNSNW